MKTDTRLIPLTQGKFTVVDAIDYGWLMQWKWQAWHDTKSRESLWYVRRSEWRPGGRIPLAVLMHRVLAVRMELPQSPLYDHKDGDGLNNTRQNIRAATKSQNGANSIISKPHTSRFRGVHLDNQTGRWRAMIKFQGKQMHLGRFDSEQEAQIAYADAALKYFGEFARF